jgi:CubicO group peptidase (beta-lactamase class C family)
VTGTAAAEDALSSVATWGFAACAGFTAGGTTHTTGPHDRVFPWASVTKLVTAIAVWVAVEEGTVSWADPAGPPGATLRHLLAHASGLAPDSAAVLAPPGRRRIYSNNGIETAAAHVAGAAGIDFPTYAAEAVLHPLGMAATRIAGSPASGAEGPLTDLLRLAAELARPSLIDGGTWRDAVTPAFPGLPGVLPGFGPQPDNSWGLGVEIRDHKDPHWTGRTSSPRTFGHFGRSGSFLWVDPDAGVAAASLAERPFGRWAAAAWPPLADAILDAAGGGGRGAGVARPRP